MVNQSGYVVPQQDSLHQMEFDTTAYHEIVHIAPTLKQCRINAIALYGKTILPPTNYLL